MWQSKLHSKYARIGVRKTGLRFVFLGALALSVCACSESSLTADSRFVGAYVEMRAAEQLYNGESPMGRLVRRDILKKYDYTREEFIKDCDKVLDDEKQWISFQLSVSSRIDSLLGIPKVVSVPKKDKK